MSLFYSKIDPYSSHTINLGPLYVERVFDSLQTRMGAKDINKLSDRDRYGQYLWYLRFELIANRKRRKTMIQFYRGYFYMKLANNTTKNPVQHYLEKALCYFQLYLEMARQRDESRYYAQWQVGVLLDILDYPWAEAEENLIRASNLDECRGEANKRIIEHYIRSKEWKTAHHFSTMAIERFLYKSPAAYRLWFVDCDAYNWQLLRVHQLICYKLGIQPDKNIAHATSTQTAPKQAQL